MMKSPSFPGMKFNEGGDSLANNAFPLFLVPGHFEVRFNLGQPFIKFLFHPV